MNRTLTGHMHYVVATAVCLSMAAVGCASSNETTESDSATQGVSSSNDYDSTNDRSAESSETGSMDKQESGGMKAPGDRMAESSGSDIEVSDAELREFASINRKMKKIQSEARTKMQSAESREEARKIQNKIQQKVQKVFDNGEMSRERYEKIGKQMRKDPELQERYRKQMRGQSG